MAMGSFGASWHYSLSSKWLDILLATNVANRLNDTDNRISKNTLSFFFIENHLMDKYIKLSVQSKHFLVAINI